MTENQAFEILAKSGRPRDARVVLRWILEKEAAGRDLSFMESARVRIAAWKLWRGIPVAKIIGKKWFYGMEFETGRATLDPRPDSETLVEAALNRAKADSRVLDLGTGTGCLVCSIVKNIPGATGVGVDISGAAVRCARRNVERLGLGGRVEIICGDFRKSYESAERRAQLWRRGFAATINRCKNLLCKFLTLTPLFALRSSLSFDIIVSNPPYIAVGDARVDAGARHDPAVALYAGPDGLSAYRAIASNAKGLLKTGGRLFIEIGAGQGAAVRGIFKGKGWRLVSSSKDLSGTERVLEFT